MNNKLSFIEQVLRLDDKAATVIAPSSAADGPGGSLD